MEKGWVEKFQKSVDILKMVFGIFEVSAVFLYACSKGCVKQKGNIPVKPSSIK
jgi:hypothetical protein